MIKQKRDRKMEKVTGYQHRDNGAIFRKNKGKVDRLSWDGKTWIPSAYRPTDLNSWPFEKLGTIEA